MTTVRSVITSNVNGRLLTSSTQESFATPPPPAGVQPRELHLKVLTIAGHVTRLRISMSQWHSYTLATLRC